MDWRLLHNACWTGDAAAVASLLAQGADPNRLAPTTWRQGPLHRTLEFRINYPRHEGHCRVVELLLAAGADPTIRATALDLTPWELACFCGLEEAESRLRIFQPRAQPHPDGMTLLWVAAASRLNEPRALRLVRRLLRAGGDPNIVWRKATPLMMAIGHAGHVRVADALVKAGADPNLGVSLVHAACGWHLEHLLSGLDYMAAHGWKVNSADGHGSTALHKAAFLGYSECIRKLLALGADTEVRDRHGMTPLAVARSWRKQAAIRLLQPCSEVEM